MIDESNATANIIAITVGPPFVMDSYEYEMIELFRKINLNRPIALTLVCLAKGREISSQHIEIMSEYREEKKSKGKGRPIKIYRLTAPLNQIFSKLEEDILAESRQALKNIELLKKIPDINDTE
jgi:predicted transcriptional regulator